MARAAYPTPAFGPSSIRCVNRTMRPVRATQRRLPFADSSLRRLTRPTVSALLITAIVVFVDFVMVVRFAVGRPTAKK